MPRPTLPPLPSPHLFSKSHLFPRKYYPSAADPMARSMPGRQIIASRQLADDFVQALDLAEGEVVLECFPGHGQVTRSLLRGGKPGKPKEEWEDWETQREAQGVGGEVGGEYIAAAVRDGSLGTGQDKDKGKAKEEGVFPWTKAELDLSRPATRGESSATDGEARRYVTPPKVVAVEPSYKLLSRALGPADEMALVNAIPAPKSVNPALRASYVAFESPQIPSINGVPSIAMTDMSAGSTSSPTSASSSFSSTAPSAPIPEAEISDTVLAKTFLLRASGKVPINQSIHDPNLVLCNATAYGWSVLPQILSHPLLSSVSKRPWTYIAPPDPSSSGRSVAAYAKYKAEADETGVPIASAAAHAEAAKPPFTVVAHIPNSVGGEQLVSQWIGSATGDMSEDGGRQWIWQWGRARLALVVQKNLYDRLMAKPGEAANCRLSILTSALFHRSPLPPYHHVANVDKLSARAYDTPLGEGAASRKKKPGKPGRPRKDKHAAVEEEAAAAVAEGKRVEVEDEERTIYPYTHRPSLYTPYLHPQPPRTRIRESDFFPIAARSSSHLYLPDAPILTRPHFLGIQLVPRVKSPVTLEQKDAWDYVLRNCFVLQGKELREAVGLLGFAAEGLLGKMEEVQQQGQDEHNVGEAAQTTTTPTRTPTAAADEGGKKKRKPWKGEAVDRRTLVRDLTVEQWARVVDVFDRWAFRPKNLLIDSGTSEEVHREIAVD